MAMHLWWKDVIRRWNVVMHEMRVMNVRIRVGRWKVMVICGMRMESRCQRLKRRRCEVLMSMYRLRLLNGPLSRKLRRDRLIISGIITVSNVGYHVLAIHASTVPRALDKARVTLAILQPMEHAPCV
jgi:hypothetical protein